MHELNDGLIKDIILTLKEIDVRGFDSMNRLVGLVMLFENILRKPPADDKNEVT